MEYKGRYMEDDNTVVFIYGTDNITVQIKVPNRTKEEALKWLYDDIIPTAQVEIMIV